MRRSSSADAAQNIDKQLHALSGASDTVAGALEVGFEDLTRTGTNSDNDFQDVVFTVEAIDPTPAVI